MKSVDELKKQRNANSYDREGYDSARKLLSREVHNYCLRFSSLNVRRRPFRLFLLR
jgi:hypothetical protein